MGGSALDLSVDLLQSLLWQHNEASNLTALLEQKQAWWNENYTQFWNDWITDVFDLRTANEFGLQVWSRILNVPLQITLPPSAPGKKTFGFGVHNQNFTHGNFSTLGGSTAGLTTDQKRTVLQMRYFKLISRPTVVEINRMLNMVFKDYGKAWVLDANDMSFVVYTFDFVPGSQLALILQSYDILPRPAGVGVKYVVAGRKTFGFGAHYENFTHGTFKPTS